ncbi:hypothetical protein [Neoroseomonas lacus]|uniref:Uncharacterized protein n=1 Tax=Neoroseomonas lacus TaxID=287609 RepID=A0A917NYH0_9PROT|nr:hypothetical protein [Neoroseomonas lacus]GGJ40853.1 hypothetical protein GCM10011320_55630 [Neoroseomonas lacus]
MADAQTRIPNKGNGEAGSGAPGRAHSSTHYATMAATHLGTASAGPALQSIAQLVRLMRDGAAASGTGSRAIKTLKSAANAAAVAGTHLRGVDILTVLQALGAPAPGEQRAPHQDAITDFSRLDLADRFGTTLLALDRLATGLEDAAKRRSPLPRGAPRRPGVLAVALDQLERVWWQHRQMPPTQSRNTGGFGDLAKAVLTASPCDFGDGTVRKAVAAYLKDTSRPAAKAHVAPAPPDPPRIETAAFFSDGHSLADEVASQLRSDGTQLSSQLIPGDVEAQGIDVAGIAEGSLDLLMLVCLGPPLTVGGERKPRELEHAMWTAGPGMMATLPARLHAVVAAHRRLLRSPGGKLVVVMPDPGSIAATGGASAYAAASTLAAIVALVGMWACDLGDDVHVCALSPGWGRDAQGLPNRHSHLPNTAAVLRTTIGQLGGRQRGRLVDLYGEPLP